VTFDAFRRVAVARTQVNGGFFSKSGLALAVEGTVRRLETNMQDVRMPAVLGDQSKVQSVNEDMQPASSLL
jgi:hypothetical protein